MLQLRLQGGAPGCAPAPRVVPPGILLPGSFLHLQSQLLFYVPKHLCVKSYDTEITPSAYIL